ncbi:MAG: PAS domain S-box protein [Syntrophobacteraceae bacterium]|nr:PAS domain S-box protein [Syntrophobacteraceae bacterium]
MHYRALTNLICNSALLIALCALYSLLARFRKKGELYFKLLCGLLFGCAAIAGMEISFSPTPAIFIDATQIVLAMAGLFGGGAAAAVSTALAGAYRTYAGGAGMWAGLSTLVLSSSLGLILRRICGKRPDTVGPLCLYWLGVMTSLATLASQLLLPHPQAFEVIRRVWLPIVLVIPVATFLCGILIRNEEQRVILEKTLWASREDYRITIDSIGDAVISTDKYGLITAMNQVAGALTAWTPDEALGRPLDDIFRIVNEKTRDVVESPVTRVLREGVVVGLANHTVLLARNGQQIPIADSGAPIRNEQGDILGVALVFRDQTEERAAQRLAALRMQLIEFSAIHSLDEFLQKALDEVASFIDSPIGFFHFVEKDQKTISVGQWSTRTRDEFCRTRGQGLHWGIDQDSVRVDCLREKKPVIHNDYDSLEHKEGMVQEHGRLLRQLAVPVMREAKAVAVLAIGNKPAAYTDKDAQTLAFLADSMWEIVERKRTEEALRESESLFRTILQTANEGFWLIDNSGATLDVNPRMCEILGRRREEVLGRKIFDFVDDQNRIVFQDHISRRKQGEPGVYEIALCRPDTSFVFCRMSATPIFDRSGVKTGSFAMVTDISKRRQAEMELLRAKTEWERTFDSVPDMVAIVDTRHRIVRANKAMAQRFGVEPQQCVGLRCCQIIHDGAPPRESCPLDLMLEDGREHVAEVHDDRLDADFVITVSPLRDEFGLLAGAVHAIRDVTRQKALEKQIRQTQKMEALGALAGGIAHDFNNILAIIMGYADIAILELAQHSVVHPALQNVRKASSRAQELVKQILAFSRKNEREPKPVEVGPIVREAVQLLRASIPATIAIRTDFDADGVLVADPTEIQQIAMNLCANASHAMRDEGGVLEIGLHGVFVSADSGSEQKGLRPGPHLRLTVSDTGKGIEPEVIERIFEPYFTTKGPGEGTGMGLAIVHGIVKNLGGAVEVHSPKGQGATFQVFFPIVNLHMEQLKNVSPPQPQRGNQERILFVDDEQPIAELGEIMLTRLGYQVSIATSSMQALELFRNNPNRFDLLISDQTMPTMTGIDLAREVLRIRPDLPVILCTGYSERLTEEMLKELGISALLMKPVDAEHLASIIRKSLDKK